MTVSKGICFRSAAEEFTSERRFKCPTQWSVWGNVEVWFVAQSVFLTEHWNLSDHIARWITACSQWDSLDTLICYLSPNRRLISARCFRSTPLPWPHCVSMGRNWRHDIARTWRKSFTGSRRVILLYFFFSLSLWFKSINVSSYHTVFFKKKKQELLSALVICVIYLFFITSTLHTFPHTCYF